MKTVLRCMVLATMAIFLGACNQMTNKTETTIAASELLIQGKAFYLQRIALPPSAELVVSVEDISLADAPSVTIASKTFPTKGKSIPLDFSLYVPLNKVKPSSVYSLRAYIQANGEKIFVTDKTYPVITDPSKTDNLEVRLVMSN